MSGLSVVAQAGGQALKGVFAVLKVARPDRPIHTRGVMLAGTLTHHRVFSGEEWLDSTGEEQVTARISRSAGLPDALPDIIGLALRIGEADVLLSTTGQGLPGRFMLRPRRSLLEGPFTSLMPFQGRGGPLVLAARREGPGPDPRRLADLHRVDAELQWGLHYSRLRGPWTRFATLQLRVSDKQSPQLRFNPTGRLPQGLSVYGWARALRDPSYALAQNQGSTVTLR